MTSQLAAAVMPAQVRSQEDLIGGWRCHHVIDDTLTGSEDDNCWSQEDDQISAQYQTIRKIKDRDTISQMSIESSDSSNQQPIFFQVSMFKKSFHQIKVFSGSKFPTVVIKTYKFTNITLIQKKT